MQAAGEAAPPGRLDAACSTLTAPAHPRQDIRGITAQILKHDPAYRMQVRGLVPMHMQEYIWAHCFRQLKGTDQRLLDCKSPVGEAEALAILGTLCATDGLLQNLRTWTAWLRVSGFVMDEVERMGKVMERQLAASST